MAQATSNTNLIITSPGALSCAKSSRGQQAVRATESNRNAKIKVDESGSPSYSNISTATWRLDVDGRIGITVKQGRVYMQVADVIVCPAMQNLKFSGEVGRELLKEGGAAIEEECKAHVGKNGPVLSGNIFVSKPGKLSNCRHIIHAVGPNEGDNEWEPAMQGSVKDCTTRSAMQGILKGCIAKSHELKAAKVALPLAFNCPADCLTEELLKALDEFVSKTPDTTLKEIFVVDMNALSLYQCTKTLKKKYHEDNSAVTSGASAAAVDGRRRPFVYNEADKTLTTEEGIKVELFTGSICKVEPPVDAIVNSTASNLNLNMGNLSKAIYEMAGAPIQDEVNQRAPQGIKKAGELVNSEGHNIFCTRCVYHCSLVAWDGDPKGNSVKVLVRAIQTALAQIDKQRHSSIAIPAIGAGILEIPLDIVLESLVTEVNRYSQKYPRTYIKRVVLVAYDKDKDAVEAFTEKFNQLIKEARKAPFTFLPQDYKLQLNIQAPTAAELKQVQEELKELFENAVTTEQIQRNRETDPDRIDVDQSKALQCLQCTHKVRITLNKSQDRLDSIEIKGFLDDVQQAKQDALKILSA